MAGQRQAIQLFQRFVQLQLAWLCLLWSPVLWSAPALDETQVKAAFLVNFSRYIEWPAPPPAQLRLAIVQDKLLFQTLQQGLLQQPSVAAGLVVEFAAADADLSQFQMVYLPKSDPQQLQLLANAMVLTVGSNDNFVKNGGMIRLVHEHNRLRFDINRAAMQQAGLKASARLLKLARKVEGKDAGD